LLLIIVDMMPVNRQWMHYMQTYPHCYIRCFLNCCFLTNDIFFLCDYFV